ncbi:hypothetical protein FB451DRAFT_1285363, partial [Mycena latifolia]
MSLRSAAFPPPSSRRRHIVRSVYRASFFPSSHLPHPASIHPFRPSIRPSRWLDIFPCIHRTSILASSASAAATSLFFATPARAPSMPSSPHVPLPFLPSPSARIPPTATRLHTRPSIPVCRVLPCPAASFLPSHRIPSFRVPSFLAPACPIRPPPHFLSFPPSLWFALCVRPPPPPHPVRIHLAMHPVRLRPVGSRSSSLAHVLPTDTGGCGGVLRYLRCARAVCSHAWTMARLTYVYASRSLHFPCLPSHRCAPRPSSARPAVGHPHLSIPSHLVFPAAHRVLHCSLFCFLFVLLPAVPSSPPTVPPLVPCVPFVGRAAALCCFVNEV